MPQALAQARRSARKRRNSRQPTNEASPAIFLGGPHLRLAYRLRAKQSSHTSLFAPAASACITRSDSTPALVSLIDKFSVED